jgi:asparagine synthase (glutamine-hydrolysing)
LSISIDPLSIISILTLRYDLTSNSPLSKLTSNDFIKKTFSKPEKTVEKIISNYYLENLVKNKNIGIALSGGIDSALLLTLLKKTYPKIPVDSFSIRFSNSFDETIVAKKIAEKFNSTHHIIEVENFLEELPKAISITKLPFWDIHWYYLAKYASQYSTDIISGDGADELFGGYTFRYDNFLRITNKNFSKREKTISYLQCHERDWVPDQEQLFGPNLHFNWKELYSIIDEYFNNDLELLDQVFLADYNGKFLYNFLIVNPKINSYFKLNSISPFLDKELIKFGTHLSNKNKYTFDQNIGKLVLKNLLQKYDMEKFVLPKKQGFSVDTKNHWECYGKFLCKNYLVDGEIVKDQLINKNWISNYLEKDLDVRYVNKFYGLLAFEIWYRLFVTKNLSDSEKLSIR